MCLPRTRPGFDFRSQYFFFFYFPRAIPTVPWSVLTRTFDLDCEATFPLALPIDNHKPGLPAHHQLWSAFRSLHSIRFWHWILQIGVFYWSQTQHLFWIWSTLVAENLLSAWLTGQLALPHLLQIQLRSLFEVILGAVQWFAHLYLWAVNGWTLFFSLGFLTLHEELKRELQGWISSHLIVFIFIETYLKSHD